MKITDKIAQWTSKDPFFTLEFFPPRTDQGFTNLLARISRLSTLHPLAISVTWGAGGSTKGRSLELAGMSQDEFNVETIMHLTCTNMEPGMVDSALMAAKARGIQNILALRGDPPRGEDTWIPTDPRFKHGIDLVKHIRSNPEFADFFCIGVASYPDGHADHNTEEDELAYLKDKVDAGADFIMTQLFYDAERFTGWIKRVREQGITAPIIPSVMPIQSYSSFLRVTKLSGCRVPEDVTTALYPIRNDDQKVKDYGVSLAISIIRQITKDPHTSVQGIHFCTLNLEKSVRRVLDGLQWSHEGESIHNRVIFPEGDPSTSLPPSILISAHDASTNATTALVHPPSSPSLQETDQLAAAKADVHGVSVTWDEFPNGRFGDPSSPAYSLGSDLWTPGANGLGITGPEALSRWGRPNTLSELDQVFLRHLDSDPRTPTTPFTPDGLSAETVPILPVLRDMTRKGWWTVGSQPAVDCAPSTDEVVGWGPSAGYVFQKAFVEFFCTEADLAQLEAKLNTADGAWVTYFAANVWDGFRTNNEDEGRNAVTWGVFPGQEVVQSTIVEKASFLTWKEEAFSIWSEWALLFHPSSAERTLLEGVRNERWLVNVVHHDYKDSNGLWKFLLN